MEALPGEGDCNSSVLARVSMLVLPICVFLSLPSFRCLHVKLLGTAVLASLTLCAEGDHGEDRIVVLSNVWLDKRETLDGLRKLFEGGCLFCKGCEMVWAERTHRTDAAHVHLHRVVCKLCVGATALTLNMEQL